jgi:hypothetical protein
MIGKEPDLVKPVIILDDDFELGIGVHEKVTHEKAKFYNT